MNVYDLFERIPLPVKPRLPPISGATAWLNSAPITAEELRGKVVLVNFGTFTCVNWIRTLPYVRAWADAYASQGLVTIGVHTPEFSIERDSSAVQRACDELRLRFPVAIDNDYAIWNAFANQYWPALYIADTAGRIHHRHFGEGGYKRSEAVIRRLLREANSVDPQGPSHPIVAAGIEAAADSQNLRSGETYVGFARSFGFANQIDELDCALPYELSLPLRINEWGIEGNWTMRRELAVMNQPNGTLAYRFHARDLNLVVAPTDMRSPVRFRVSLDGLPPKDAHGLDADDNGAGIISEPRLYQLIRQPAPIEDRLFEIEFLDGGAEVFCLTFG